MMMRMVKIGISYLRFVGTYLVVNTQAAMEYRVAFWVEIGSLFFSDCLWVFFWLSYFQQFPLVNGWKSTDVVIIWGVSACGFGIYSAICGNTRRLAGLIMNGGLDAYLSMPRNVLIHVCVASMRPAAWGDILFGLGVFFVLFRPGPLQIALFLLLVLLIALMITAFLVIIGSLAFFVGNTEGLSGLLLEMLISFSTYPMQIFHGFVKLLLFTVLPAGFVSFVPLQLLHEFSWPLMGAMVGMTALVTMAAIGVFYAGLRRYESGNLLGMQE
jgi:ABC-2 type transport system permease protein